MKNNSEKMDTTTDLKEKNNKETDKQEMRKVMQSSKGHTKCVTENTTVLDPDMAREHP